MTDGVISSNAENVQYNYLADNNNDNPWEDAFKTRLDYTVSQPLADTLNSFGDPRITVYANKATATGTYVDMPYSVTESEAGAIPNLSVSFLGDALRTQTSPTYIYLDTFSQVLFSMVEAAKRGWIPGGEVAAAGFYNQAIAASWEQYGVYIEETFNTYISKSKVAYKAGIGLQQIALQKMDFAVFEWLRGLGGMEKAGLSNFEPCPGKFECSWNFPPPGLCFVRSDAK